MTASVTIVFITFIHILTIYMFTMVYSMMACCIQNIFQWTQLPNNLKKYIKHQILKSQPVDRQSPYGSRRKASLVILSESLEMRAPSSSTSTLRGRSEEGFAPIYEKYILKVLIPYKATLYIETQLGHRGQSRVNCKIQINQLAIIAARYVNLIVVLMRSKHFTVVDQFVNYLPLCGSRIDTKD